MKQIFILFLLAITSQAKATVLTVSNSPATIAQFNTIQAAINAASSGDTIYVHGSPNIYAGFTQSNIKLTIIGPGWSPEKALPLNAQVQSTTITGISCANSEYQGLAFVGSISINSSKPDNLRFIRNHFFNNDININQNAATYTGYLFEGNLFDNASLNAIVNSTYQNFILQNNYFFENGTIRDANFNGFFNSVNVLFTHNLWFGPSSGIRNAASGGNNRFLTFANNIFIRRNVFNSITSSSFSNNITFYPAGSTNPGAPWTGSNVDGGGNIDNQDPQLVSQAAINAGSNNPLNDFTVAAGPANNAGSDGKDIGLLFDAIGSLNWANSRNSRLPRIFSMSVVSPSVAAGANVVINVDARVSN